MAKQNQMGDNPEVYAIPTNTNWHDAPAADTAASITLAAVAERRQCCLKPVWSYSAQPTGGQLTITTGGEVIFQIDITEGGPGFLPVQLRGKLGQNLVVTLAAGGGGVTGKINVEKAWLE